MIYMIFMNNDNIIILLEWYIRNILVV